MNSSTVEREVVVLDIARDRQTILDQMERMLASAHFRNSKRYPVFLRYVIEATLRGNGESLKERTVGVDAFQRDPDYDTNADPIVRVTAGEVRKRIAQYYHEDGREDEVRIDLASGTYIPVFSLRKDSSQERPRSPFSDSVAPIPPYDTGPEVPVPLPAAILPSRTRISGSAAKVLAAVALLLLLLAGSGVWLYWRQTSSPFAGAWKPFYSTTPPVLINIGEPSLARSPDITPQDRPVTVREHLYMANGLVFSDVQALVQLTAVLDRQNVPHRLQPASATSFADMRQGPAILLGGLDNPWTLRVLSNKRFRFIRQDAGLSWIEDRNDPTSHRWAVDFRRPYQELTADYAIVARFMEPDTGQPVMVVAGVGENGTKAASEFMTDPTALRIFSSSEPNIEIVLGTSVVKGISGPPRVLAKVAW